VLENRRADGYVLSSDPDRFDLTTVHRWLSTDAYWAMDRPIERMRAAADGSECYGIYLGSQQVAVARVVTDGAIFAYLCDVYVERTHRGRGLGGWLVSSLCEHLAARGITRFLLVTRDAQPLYAQHGFRAVDPGRWMECDLSHRQRPASVRGLTVQP
jgi:GNAT superfamily N-acetyltransferase